jgi:hypothetical protein
MEEEEEEGEDGMEGRARLVAVDVLSNSVVR